MTLKRLSTGFPIGSLILAIVGLTCAGLTRLHSQRTTLALVDPEDPSSEQPLQQPGDPSRSELSPEEALLPGDEAGEVSPESTPAEEGARGSENAEDEEEANGDVIKFDPSKAVVRPARVVPDPPTRSGSLPPPPTHSANPEVDLFEHAALLAKHEEWALAEQRYSLYIQNYPNHQRTQAAYYGLAEARMKLGKLLEAEATYRALLRRYRQGDHVGAAAYRLANIHYRRQEHKDAVGYFELASRMADKTLVKQSAAFFRARCLQQLNNSRLSEQIFRQLASTPEDHPYRAASAIILARMDVERNQYQPAYDAFVKLTDPSVAANIRAEALTKAGLMAAKLDLPSEAQNYFENILADRTEDAVPWHPKAFRGLLHLLYEEGRYQELIDQYQDRRISYAESTAAARQARLPILFMVAHSFRRLEKYRQAASLYDQVYRLDPERPDAREAGYRHLYCLYKDESPFLGAKIDDYLESQRETGGTGHQFYHLTLLLKAEALFAQRQKTSKVYAQAADAYESIELSLIPPKYHPLVTYKLGWAHCEADNHSKGIRALYRFLEEHADDHPELVGKALAKRGEAQRKFGNYDEAKKDFDQLVSLSEDKNLIYLGLQQNALIDVERKDHESTIVSFQSLLDRFPDGVGTAEAHFFIGDAHYQLRNFEDAIGPLTQSRELDPQSYTIPATQRMIISHWRRDSLEEAAAEVDVLLNADPKTNLIPPKLWLWLGTRSFQIDRFEQAARYLQQVANPKAPKDTWPLAWSFLGRAYLHSGKYAEAIEPLDHYLASNPARSERAKTLLHKATALSKTGRLDEAQSAAEEVQLLQKQGRTYGLSWILLGDISMAKEDFEKASKYYVIPSRMFKDPLVTPVALEKAAEAFDRMGENERGADLRRQLEKEWPRYQTASTGQE